MMAVERRREGTVTTAAARPPPHHHLGTTLRYTVSSVGVHTKMYAGSRTTDDHSIEEPSFRLSLDIILLFLKYRAFTRRGHDETHQSCVLTSCASTAISTHSVRNTAHAYQWKHRRGLYGHKY